MLIYGGSALNNQQNDFSEYYGDLWLFDTDAMEWSEIKASGELPHPRSGASMHYDYLNNRVILFGGQAAEDCFLNDVYELDWKTKEWRQLFSEQQSFRNI